MAGIGGRGSESRRHTPGGTDLVRRMTAQSDATDKTKAGYTFDTLRSNWVC